MIAGVAEKGQGDVGILPRGAGGRGEEDGGVVAAAGARGCRRFVAGVAEAAEVAVELAPVSSWGQNDTRKASRDAHELGEVKETGGRN